MQKPTERARLGHLTGLAPKKQGQEKNRVPKNEKPRAGKLRVFVSDKAQSKKQTSFATLKDLKFPGFSDCAPDR